MRRLTKRQKWILLAAGTSAVVAPVAERVVSSVWEAAMGEGPPVDEVGSRIPWGRLIAWTAVSAVVVGLAQVGARRGAAMTWEHMTGERPPRPKRRRRVA